MYQVLEAISVLSPVLAGFFGIFGLVNKYKDEEGRTTRHGRIAIWGIVASAFLSLTNASIGILVKADERKASLERISADIARQEQTLEEIRRLAYPLNDIKVSMVFSVPADHPRIRAHHRRMESTYASIMKDVEDRRTVLSHGPDLFVQTASNQPFVERITLFDWSSRFPRDVLITYDIALLDSSYPVENYDHWKRKDEIPLRLTFGDTVEARVDYLPLESRYLFTYVFVPLSHLGSGEISSYLDLRGKRVVLSVLTADEFRGWEPVQIRLFSSLGYSVRIRRETLQNHNAALPKATYSGIVQ